MYMRMLQVRLKQDDVPNFVRLYEDRIIPALDKIGGCLFACLLQSTELKEEGISLTLWRSDEDSSRYERSGLFMQLVAEARPFFAEMSEMKLQLSKDFTLEYGPEPAQPTLKTFSVSTSGGSTLSSPGKRQPPFLRIVSLHLKPGKLEEYKQRYQRDIVPALLATRGCQFSCLSTPTDDSLEAISVTLWNSRADAEEYERTGTFDRLLKGISHTLSDLSQLRLQTSGTRFHSVTSEDVAVDGFLLIAGKSFVGGGDSSR